MNLAELRREYRLATLDEAQVARDPLAQFSAWLQQAIDAELPEPHAMTLATATASEGPTARVVLLKGLVPPLSFHFYTDYRSRKGRDVERDPRAALCFLWAELERQVRVTGTVTKLPHESSREYWRTRPLESRLSAWASQQSSAVAGRAELEARVAGLRRELGDDPPLPPHWGGYALEGARIEFWQGRESRLHDRIEYARDGAAWRIRRLSP